jgi:preprotein translocase subunit SecD
MVSRPSRFNIYLLLLVALTALTGCQSPETKREKQLATIRISLEINPYPPGRGQQIAFLRSAPVQLTVENAPFLNENHVESAKVVQTPGGFVLAIHFNQQGQWLLEQYTAANPKRRLAIRCQWGVPPDVQDRWVAAPLITQRIKDGMLTFTPDASRDEADQIAIGLNNMAGDSLLKDKSNPPPTTGGTQ